MFRRFWVLSADGNISERYAANVSAMLKSFPPLDDASPTDCNYCILPKNRVFMLYWTAPKEGPVTKHLNFVASRILADKFLLDTWLPTTPPDCRPFLEAVDEEYEDEAVQEQHRVWLKEEAERREADKQREWDTDDCRRIEMQRAMRCCPHGDVIIFRADENELLLDYPLSSLLADWSHFFVANCPWTQPHLAGMLQSIPYTHMWYETVLYSIVRHALGEPFRNTLPQRQRAETVLIAFNLYMLCPQRWQRFSKFGTGVRVHFSGPDPNDFLC